MIDEFGFLERGTDCTTSYLGRGLTSTRHIQTICARRNGVLQWPGSTNPRIAEEEWVQSGRHALARLLCPVLAEGRGWQAYHVADASANLQTIRNSDA